MALWPGYIERAYPIRQYALMNQYGAVTTEHGETAHLTSWDDTRHFLSSSNATLFSKSLLPFVAWGAPRDRAARVNATKSGAVSSISVRFSNRRIRSVVASPVWGELSPDFEMLGRIRRLMRLCSVGDRTTPSALGLALMRQSWAVHGLRWRWSAPIVVQEILTKHSAPPRTESPGVGTGSHFMAHEYDINNAFASHFRELPTGQVLTITPLETGQWHDDCATWFRRCNLTLTERARIAPVPVFDGDVWKWPKYGSFETWLWKEQAESAREMGVKITPHYGFGWMELFKDMEYWCDEVARLKIVAPADLLPLVKLLIVASIGRFAMPPSAHEVIDYYDPDLPCRPFLGEIGADPFTDYYLAMKSQGRGNFVHWQRYSVMRTNQTLFNMARHLDEGELLQTNFDSILTTQELPIDDTWKHSILKNVRMPYPRSVISDSKVRLPGIPRQGTMKI